MPSASAGETTGNSMGRVVPRASVSKATVRLRPKATHRSHSGLKASVASISMKVAKASFSQMPFHHFMVTRSPNHMWASSWAITSVTFWSSVWVTSVGFDQHQGLAEGDTTQVLHGPEGEVGHRHQVDLVAGVGEAEVLGEEAQAEGAHLEGVAGQVALAAGVHDPQGGAVHVHGIGHLERARR